MTQDRAAQKGTDAGRGDDGLSPIPRERALVAGTPPAPAGAEAPVQSFAPFIAQLVATRLGLPQTRERRRGTASECVRAYAAPGALAKRATGRRI